VFGSVLRDDFDPARSDIDVLADFNVGDIIAAFNSENNCVGYSKIENINENLGLVLFGDDFTTSEIDGMLENESIWLKLIRKDTQEEIYLDYEFDQSLPDNLPIFREMGLSRIIKFQNISSVIVPVERSFNIQVYPNPTKGEFILSFDNDDFNTCNMEIFRIDGQLVKNENIGQARTAFNIGDMPAGIYLLKIYVDGQIIKKRLILQ